jgi:hypothetical protein
MNLCFLLTSKTNLKMRKDKYIFTALFDETNVLSKILVAVKIDIALYIG